MLVADSAGLVQRKWKENLEKRKWTMSAFHSNES